MSERVKLYDKYDKLRLELLDDFNEHLPGKEHRTLTKEQFLDIVSEKISLGEITVFDFSVLKEGYGTPTIYRGKYWVKRGKEHV